MGMLKTSGSCTVTENSLEFDPSCTWEQWCAKGKELHTFIKVMDRHFRWWLGDWINYGQQRFAEKYTQALEMEMYSIGSLRNASWVCRHVPIENRMIDANISFEHHYAVAAMPPEKQKDWLDASIRNKWTVRQLRCALDGKRVSTQAVPKKVEFKIPDKPTFDLWWENVGVHIARSFQLEEKSCERIAAQAWSDAKQWEPSRRDFGGSSPSISASATAR